MVTPYDLLIYKVTLTVITFFHEVSAAARCTRHNESEP